MIPSIPISLYNVLVSVLPSTPSNLSITGSILTWSNTDTSVTYKVYNIKSADVDINGNEYDYSDPNAPNVYTYSDVIYLAGTTTGHSLDISSSIVPGRNTISVKSYNANNVFWPF